MRFLQGIYGIDFLSVFLLFMSSIFSFWRVTRVLELAILFVIVFRTFSKNIYKRKQENLAFCRQVNKLLGRFNISLPDNFPVLDGYSLSLLMNRIKYNIEQKRTYKTVICPGCHKKLKLPRGRGKVIITCKTCMTEFKAKV